eukprot:scaffold4503_cov92-Isochrysis_galbana.AAC.2
MLECAIAYCSATSTLPRPATRTTIQGTPAHPPGICFYFWARQLDATGGSIAARRLQASHGGPWPISGEERAGRSRARWQRAAGASSS